MLISISHLSRSLKNLQIFLAYYSGSSGIFWWFFIRDSEAWDASSQEYIGDSVGRSRKRPLLERKAWNLIIGGLRDRSWAEVRPGQGPKMGAPSIVSPRLGRASAHGRPDAAPGNMLRLVLCAPEPARSDPRASLRRAGPLSRPMKNHRIMPVQALFLHPAQERSEYPG